MKFVRIAGWVISVISIAYIVYKVINLRVDFTLMLRPRTALLLLAGVTLHILSMTLLAQAYYAILNLFQKANSPRLGYFNLYAKSNLAKYLPGNVMHLVSRNISASEVGADQKEVAIASIIEIILVLAAALSLVVIIRPAQIEMIFMWLTPLHVIVASAVFAIVIFFGAAKMKSLQWPRELRWNRNIFYRALFILSLYTITLILQALIPVVIAISMSEISLNATVAGDLINGFLVSWSAGFLTIGAPGGIGVRELIFCSLVPSIGYDALLFISISQRLVNITGDILFFLMIWLLSGPQKIVSNDQAPK
jgi:glycosyltransferase 2 family protein